ncbi:MAG: DinB family protein [Anaerolineales bacterium]|nr:DinB family protein [Anaerolineales bacterium]
MNLQETLIQELDEARAAMRAVVQRASENTEIYAAWKMKEVLAHITGWDEATLAALRAHTRDETPTTPANQGIDAYNAETVARYEKASYPQILHAWEHTRTQLKAIIQELPARKFEEPLIFPWGPTGTVAQIVRIMSHHEQEHADEIRQFFES